MNLMVERERLDNAVSGSYEQAEEEHEETDEANEGSNCNISFKRLRHSVDAERENSVIEVQRIHFCFSVTFLRYA